MRIAEKIFTFLLATVIILACAFLPEIVFSLYDNSTTGNIQEISMDTLQLSSKDTNKLTVFEKMKLMEMNISTVVSNENGDFSPEQVETIVREKLASYSRAGLIEEESISLPIENCSLRIFYDYQTSDKHMLFWDIELKSENPNQQIYLTIEDGTGYIYSIHYSSVEATLPFSEYENLLTEFAALFYNDMGLHYELLIPVDDMAVGIVVDESGNNYNTQFHISPYAFSTKYSIGQSG